MVLWGMTDLPMLKPPKPVVYVSHTQHVPIEKFKKKLLLQCTNFAAVSQAACAVFGNGEKVRVVYNGIDPSRISSKLTVAQARAKYGLPEKGIIIGHLGRITMEKGCLYGAQLAKEAKCHYVMMGPCSDGGGTVNVLHLIEKMGLTHKVIPYDAHVGDFFRAIDIQILASKAEAMPLVMIEGWLAGVPIISTRVGAVPELEAQHGKMVVSIKDSSKVDPYLVAEAISEENRTTIERARNVARENFKISTMASRWASYFREIVPRK